MDSEADSENKTSYAPGDRIPAFSLTSSHLLSLVYSMPDSRAQIQRGPPSWTHQLTPFGVFCGASFVQCTAATTTTQRPEQSLGYTLARLAPRTAARNLNTTIAVPTFHAACVRDDGLSLKRSWWRVHLAMRCACATPPTRNIEPSPPMMWVSLGRRCTSCAKNQLIESYFAFQSIPQRYQHATTHGSQAVDHFVPQS